jgi:hypothetical protein
VRLDRAGPLLNPRSNGSIAQYRNRPRTEFALSSRKTQECTKRKVASLSSLQLLLKSLHRAAIDRAGEHAASLGEISSP